MKGKLVHKELVGSQWLKFYSGAFFISLGKTINSLQYNHQSKGNSPINMCADMAPSREV